MITKHNWLNTNIGERLLDKSVGLKLNIKPYKFKNISFDEATDLTCFQINNMNKEIYVALSGGYDSE
jgi:predicted HTH domain antitoxin